jgi:hypothetical protein
MVLNLGYHGTIRFNTLRSKSRSRLTGVTGTSTNFLTSMLYEVSLVTELFFTFYASKSLFVGQRMMFHTRLSLKRFHTDWTAVFLFIVMCNHVLCHTILPCKGCRT